jgi:membrane AbrB-like protein
MRPAAPRRRADILTTVETLAIGAAGGVAFAAAALPGGLISGAMIAVAIAAIAGRPLRLPAPVAQGILVVLGISLGSMVTRDLLANLAAYPVTLILLTLSTLGATLGSSLYLQRVYGWDRTSALLAASPGALSQIVIIAHDKNADVPAIAVVQTVRVILLTAGLPLLLAAAGLAHEAAPLHAARVAGPLALAVLALAAVATGWLLRITRFPAGWMFGAMLASAILHGGGWIEGGLPDWGRAAALIGIGALIGTRFARLSPRTIVGYLAASLGSFAVALAVSAVFVAAALIVAPLRFADVIVAFAPGAMDAMLALALTLHIDPIFVGAHHLARFLVVSVATPGIVQLFSRPQQDADD